MGRWGEGLRHISSSGKGVRFSPSVGDVMQLLRVLDRAGGEGMGDGGRRGTKPENWTAESIRHFSLIRHMSCGRDLVHPGCPPSPTSIFHVVRRKTGVLLQGTQQAFFCESRKSEGLGTRPDLANRPHSSHREQKKKNIPLDVIAVRFPSTFLERMQAPGFAKT